MGKRHHVPDNPEKWINHISKLRGENDIHLLQAAVNLYDNKVLSLLEKGLGIADILLSLGLDTEALASALAYPALQFHEIHLDTVADCLGESNRKLLQDVLQMQSLGKLQHLQKRGGHQIENLRKMLLAMVTDVRAVLIILAERLWQLRKAKKLSLNEQSQLAQETLAVYAPLANRLGVWQLKWEIEDLCLRYLQKEIYLQIAKGIASRRDEREEYIHRVISIITALLKNAGLQDFQVTGRVKHIYSIYHKMQRKNTNLEKIYDMSALRVLVPRIEDCYTVLGTLQNEWRQIPEEFDDYIAQSKPNGYRSIHTVLIGPEAHTIEVQIRTYQMHHESELGVAAHWRYKEGVLQPSHDEAKIALLRQIIAWQKDVVTTDETSPGQLSQDVFANRIYVFTPAGDIIDLPNGATPLDFAYHVHSEIGHRCRGAKVNGNIVPLTHPLQTGERIEILTAKQAQPSRDWLNPHLNYLKSARARAKVQHYFRVQDNIQPISEAPEIPEGREILEKAVSTIPSSGLRSIEHGTASSIQVLGINNLLTHMARCCKPLPGDKVVGYITRNRGISVHRLNCTNLLYTTKEDQKRLVNVNWASKQTGAYSADLIIYTVDRSGLLRDITTLLASEKINVLGLQTKKSRDTTRAEIYLTIEIASGQELKHALDLLKQVPNVLEVKRR